jgi:hypothetical protein
VRREQSAKLKQEATEWLDDVAEARAKATANYEWAKTEGDPPDANGAVAQLLKVAELKARGTGAFAKAEAAAWAKYGLPSEAALKAAVAFYLDGQSADEPAAFSRALRLVAAYLARHPAERQHALQAIGGVRVIEQDDGQRALSARVGQNGGEVVSSGTPSDNGG